MIERLTNCPSCGGTLNEAGRCEFCGSKVFDFLTFDFNKRNMSSAPTYIRLKVNGKIVIAPIIVDTMSASLEQSNISCVCTIYDNEYLRTPCNPTLSVDFKVIGDVIEIDEEGDKN